MWLLAHVIDRLEMPDAFAAAGIQRDQAGAVQIVARTEAAVVVDGGAVGRDVDDIVFHIGGNRRPGRNIAGPLPGIVFPGFMAVFAGPRNHVEFPFEGAAGFVVAENIAGHVFDAGLVVALLGGVAHDYGVVDDYRRRRRSDVAGFQRNALVGVVGMAQIREHIHHAALRKTVHRHRLAESLQRCAGCGIKGHEKETGRGHIDHAAAVHFIVGDAFAVVGAHGIFPAARIRQAVAPQRFSAGGVDGDDMTSITRDCIQHAIDIAGGGASADRAHAGAVPNPGDLELAEVIGGDLGGFGVSRLGEIVAQGEPFHGVRCRRVLGEQRTGAEQQSGQRQGGSRGAGEIGETLHFRPRRFHCSRLWFFRLVEQPGRLPQAVLLVEQQNVSADSSSGAAEAGHIEVGGGQTGSQGFELGFRQRQQRRARAHPGRVSAIDRDRGFDRGDHGRGFEQLANGGQSSLTIGGVRLPPIGAERGHGGGIQIGRGGNAAGATRLHVPQQEALGAAEYAEIRPAGGIQRGGLLPTAGTVLDAGDGIGPSLHQPIDQCHGIGRLRHGREVVEIDL